jgi:hypothetical protein
MERSVVRPAIEITYLRLLREIKLYPRKPEVAKAFETDTTDLRNDEMIDRSQSLPTQDEITHALF